MTEKIKTSIAFIILGVLILAGFILVRADRPADVYPNENTMIRLYGEAHGEKLYYDLELKLWQENYKEGCRNLFIELPYYSAEFLNLWMQGGSEEILNDFFEDIRGTQSGNDYYKEFFQEIRESCPETVFYGTDVGHQFDTTGARYLKYLKDKGLADSEKYALAEACIRQGQEYYASGDTETGISDIRESYMVSNFVDAYERCGGGKVMGIYGSYHTELDAPGRMAHLLKIQYGDIISSVKLSSLVMKRNPYQIGFSITGLVFFLMLTIPNMIWARREKPVGYEEAAAKENMFLLLMERAGEVCVTAALFVFPALNPNIRKLPEGLYFDIKIIFWILAFVLMILYECYWIRYFRSEGTMKDFYSSFAGFPVAGASLPVIAAILLGIYSGNMLFLAASIILGIGHIGIHAMHKREIG